MHIHALALVLLLIANISILQAAPRVPASDQAVLEIVPAAQAVERLDRLRARVAAHPEDQQAAFELAKGYLEIGRSTGDPRFVSYSQATLGPWLSRAEVSPAALVLGATALQHLHRFDAALVLLNRAIAAEPLNAQALLTKATVLQVQGRFNDARGACRPLIQAAGQLVAVACLTSIDSLTGNLDRSYQALNAVFQDDARLPANLRIWVMGLLADMAVRRGDLREGERWLRAALFVAPNDIYIKADYADLLLSERRFEEVIQLLKNNEAQDNLLLRLAIAGTSLHSAAGARWAGEFQARFEAARRDGDFTHLREQARFFLEVRSDPKRALQLAQENWQVQREPADVQIYRRAASAAQNRDALSRIDAWMSSTRYEDRTLR